MKRSVVLIDDDHGPMDYYVEAMETRGFVVTQFDSVDETYKWLDDVDTPPPDLVVVDIMLPPQTRLAAEQTDNGVRSGVFVARDILKKWPTMPILVLTNRPEPGVTGLLPAGTKVIAKFETAPFGFADFVLGTLSQK
jgi:DNA-binding response OmpR family regulator